MPDKLSDFLPEPTVRITLTEAELDLLIHFAGLGHEMVYQRNNYGDRAVAREVAPIIDRLARTLASKASFEGF